MPPGYDCETVYLAELAHDSIYFVFTNRRKSLLSIMRADVSDDDWTHYNVSNATAAIRHPVTSGAWIVRFPPRGTTAPVEIVFKKKSEKGCVFKPHIHETNMMVPSEDIFKRDDMVDAAIYGTAYTPAEHAKEEVRRTLKWYEKAKKEVKKEMTNKSLFHVILFNRKTEEIAFDVIIPASNEQDAVMQAAQLHGKYDSKVHLTIVWQLQYSEYTPIKD